MLPPNFLKTVFIAGVGYWLCGLAAGFLVIPPGFASPIWPAAGFAYLMVLARGKWVALGVLCASFLINLSFAGASLLEPSPVFVPSFCIAFGAAMQTLAARWLTLRFTHFPDVIRHGNDALLIGLLAGPLACILSSSIGVASLIAAGVMPANAAGLNWLNWWIGDSVGVLIFAPIILAPHLGIHWGEKRKLTLFFAVYLGLVLIVMLLFVAARDSQQLKLQQLFREKVEGVHSALLKQLENMEHASQTLVSVFTTFGKPTREQFAEYAMGVYAHTSGSQALSWIPIVSASQRENYEQQLYRVANDSIGFSERDVEGRLISAAKREVYYPVFYIEPYATNTAALGYDLGSDGKRLAAITQVIESQNSLVTEPIILVQEQGSSSSILLLSPVVKSVAEGGARERGARKIVTSLVSTVYRAKDVLDAALPADISRYAAITFRDSAAREGEYFYVSGIEGRGASISKEIEFLGRKWIVSYTQTDEFIHENQTLAVWVVLVCGFVLVTIFGLFFLLLLSRAAFVEKEVESKTLALNAAVIKAEQASKIKSDFLASMSHELRTPLNSIIGFSVRLLRTADAEKDKRLRSSLEIIERNGKHLLTLINEILDLSKVEAGRMELIFEDVYFVPLLDDLRELASPLVEAKSLTLNIGVIPIESIRADRTRLLQILINLVSNGIKFTDEGAITIDGVLAERQGKAGLELRVSDTGRGMDEQGLLKIFRRYEQLVNSANVGELGTGLGLALAQELVMLHGGEITAKSTVGAGSTFTLWLPINKH